MYVCMYVYVDILTFFYMLSVYWYDYFEQRFQDIQTVIHAYIHVHIYLYIHTYIHTYRQLFMTYP